MVAFFFLLFVRHLVLGLQLFRLQKDSLSVLDKGWVTQTYGIVIQKSMAKDPDNGMTLKFTLNWILIMLYYLSGLEPVK